MKKKALIIGSEGNIGKPLKKYLIKKNYLVREIDIKPGWKKNFLVGDINFPLDILPAFDWRPNYVFLLSAMVSRVTCEQASSLAVSTNLSGIHNIITLCKRIKAKLIFFSTSEVYGPYLKKMDENISNPNPNNIYGLTKLLGEKLVEYEVNNGDLEAVTIRPFMMYDENEDLGDHRSAMIRFATNLCLGKKIEVHNGSARGWLHVSDAVKAIEAATRVKRYQKINIGHPDIKPIKILAEKIRKELGASKKLIKYVNLPNKMTLTKYPSLKNQKLYLKISPKVGLDQGIKLVCNMIKKRLIKF